MRLGENWEGRSLVSDVRYGRRMRGLLPMSIRGWSWAGQKMIPMARLIENTC